MRRAKFQSKIATEPLGKGDGRRIARGAMDVPVLVFVLLPKPPKVEVLLFWPKPPLPKPNDMAGDYVDDSKSRSDEEFDVVVKIWGKGARHRCARRVENRGAVGIPDGRKEGKNTKSRMGKKLDGNPPHKPKR